MLTSASALSVNFLISPAYVVRGQPDSGLYDAIDDPVLKRKVDISMYMLIFILQMAFFFTGAHSITPLYSSWSTRFRIV
jgi:hypothetical protein